MKICISGAGSQGKSTIINALAQHEMFKDFTFKTNLTRDLQKAGLKINEAGNDVTQLFIMAKHLEYAQLPGSVVLDRCALDGLAYTDVILKDYTDIDFMTALGYIGRKCLKEYSVIFYVKPELPLVEDGVRTLNKSFFDATVNSFNKWIDVVRTYNITAPIIEISGTVEQRINQIINNITKLNLC